MSAIESQMMTPTLVQHAVRRRSATEPRPLVLGALEELMLSCLLLCLPSFMLF